jgi:hypothetical protein
MNRILSLQMMEPTGFDMFGQDVDSLMDSTSSRDGCVCSTTSLSACPATEAGGFAI